MTVAQSKSYPVWYVCFWPNLGLVNYPRTPERSLFSKQTVKFFPSKSRCFPDTGMRFLTIYDMCKAIDRGMIISDVRVMEKLGGKSGHWKTDE